ncbi:hypothetical protein EX30DRAFT_383879 [Ascodesmis nigricans]|uniref:Uncharacterized protein n=1 Tax=Ascodesmis nigricans TaxID=341454 RepID=A0A4S2MSD4_9PEZI|nr:hypothetical protein EX30DRAFT_383879 [Ascodesmis nigricans]
MVLFGPILFRSSEAMTPDDYEAYCDFIEAIESAMSDVAINDIARTVRNPLIKFIKHYVDTYYGGQWECLGAMRAQIHFLAHVTDFLEWVGPLNLYSQWCCERACGIIASSVKNLVQANRTASLALLRHQQLRSLPLLAKQSNGQIPLPRTLITTLLSHNGSSENKIEQSDKSSRSLLIRLAAILDVTTPQRISRNLQSVAAPGNAENIFFLPAGLLGEPTTTITDRTRRQIRGFLAENGYTVAIEAIPNEITAYRALRAAYDGNMVYSEQIESLRVSRSRSYASYLFWKASRRDSASYSYRRFYGKYKISTENESDVCSASWYARRSSALQRPGQPFLRDEAAVGFNRVIYVPLEAPMNSNFTAN